MISAQERYMSTRVLTATPEQLVVMVYDEAIKSLKKAKAALSSGGIPEANRQLQKAQEAVALLQSSLNHGAGEIAVRLDALYDFIKRHLIMANLKKDAQAIDEVQSLLEGLRASWAEIAGLPKE